MGPMEQAREQLDPRVGETELPGPVAETAKFFADHGIWCLFGRNGKALSCKDAAHKRYRLGKRGIPLEDELKSFLGHYTDSDGRLCYVAVHCRGDQFLDIGKIRAATGGHGAIERLATDASDENEGLYGLINPFSLTAGVRDVPVHQLFDPCVLEHRGLPNTMMTNAGERTWSVEFHPSSVVHALGNQACLADVTENKAVRRSGPVTIGIITGNAPDSGIILWQYINRHVQTVLGDRFLGDLSYPPVSVRSVPGLGLSMELDKRSEQVWEELEQAVRSLCEEGVQILSLACHTTHYFTDRIRAITQTYGASFLSVSECVTQWARCHGVPELTLVGIKYVAGLGEWSAYRNLAEITRVQPLSEKGLKRIHELGYQVKREGASEAGLNKLRSILDSEANTSHIVIALTELSILLDFQRKPQKSTRVIMDALKIYAEEVANTYIGWANPRELS
ncbi:aspartate/glutamate racemase family protein [Rhodospira trueperi]|uniref:Aspartate/glutamate racemase n=1 Tax=Rhodospira trueperi TaxID=69960 RepID=A0A1G7HJ10_9PROT|nr:aspartate/glutamate racemase family protein [Rhodospira trueperi]SDF00472.1 Aspartate/glutamate racemase [Rhodospira trueperi]